EEPTFCLNTEEVPKREPWYERIKEFLQTGKYLENILIKEQKALRRLASHFLLIGNLLYRKSFNASLLRCMDETKADMLMKEVHEGVCGPNMNGYMLAKKIMKLSYF